MSLTVGSSPAPLLQLCCDAKILQYAAHVTLQENFLVTGNTNGPTPSSEVKYIFVIPYGVTAVHYLKVTASHYLKKAEKWICAESESVEGKVQPKQAARETYEDSIAEGKSFVALLEETKAPTGRELSLKFTVGAFEPQEPCDEHVILLTVQIKYVTELTNHQTSDEIEEQVNWMKFELPSSMLPATPVDTPKLEKCGFLEQYKFKVNATVNLSEGQIVDKVMSPSHQVTVTQEGSVAHVTHVTDVAQVTRVTNESTRPQTVDLFDFLTTSSTSAPSSQQDNGFVLLVKQSTAEPIAQAVIEPMPTEDNLEKYAVMIPVCPRFDNLDTVNSEFIFLVDCSGSMSGSPINQAARAIKLFIQSLPADCYVNIYRFGSTYQKLFHSSQPLNEDNLKKAKQYVENMSADLGGTTLNTPLNAILQAPVARQGLARQLFILTDGEVDNPDLCVQIVRSHHGNTRVFSFGIGASCDRKLVANLAIAGEGNYEFVKTETRMEPVVIRQLKSALMPSFTDVSIDWQSLTSYVHPSYGTIPPIYFHSRFLVYALLDDIPSNLTGASIKLTAKSNEGAVIEQSIPITIKQQSKSTTSAAVDLSDYPIHLLAAYKKITELDEYQDNSSFKLTKEASKQEIIRLATKYQLTSSETSLVAVSLNHQTAVAPEPTATFESRSINNLFSFHQMSAPAVNNYGNTTFTTSSTRSSSTMVLDDLMGSAPVDTFVNFSYSYKPPNNAGNQDPFDDFMFSQPPPTVAAKSTTTNAFSFGASTSQPSVRVMDFACFEDAPDPFAAPAPAPDPKPTTTNAFSFGASSNPFDPSPTPPPSQPSTWKPAAEEFGSFGNDNFSGDFDDFSDDFGSFSFSSANPVATSANSFLFGEAKSTPTPPPNATALNPFAAPAPKPAADRQTLDKILFSQKSDGSWTLDSQLCYLLDVNVPASIASQFDTSALATYLVIHVLNLKFLPFKEEYHFIVQKGMQFLKKKGLTALLRQVENDLYSKVKNP